jgi:hypothetical protein
MKVPEAKLYIPADVIKLESFERVDTLRAGVGFVVPAKRDSAADRLHTAPQGTQASTSTGLRSPPIPV